METKEICKIIALVIFAIPIAPIIRIWSYINEIMEAICDLKKL